MKHTVDSKHAGREISASVERGGEWSVANGEWEGASIIDQRAHFPRINAGEWSMVNGEWSGASTHDPRRHSPIHQLPFTIHPPRYFPIHQLPFTIRLFLLASILLLPTLLRAQEIILTLNIIPPYSAYVYDYADLSGQAVITLTNTTMEVKQVRLEGILANATSGLFVRTEPGHRGPSPIIIPPGGSVVLSTQPGVMEFLAPENVTTNADQSVEQAIVQTSQLPEGLYRLCVEAYDYNGPQLLSQPGGACFSFGLYYANPPMITQPVNGTEVSAYMTNPVFSWTPPLGNLAGALIEYDLLVTPVFPGQNPNDAIIAARTYVRAQPVLLKEGLMSNVYVRQVQDLPFEQGKQYAMQVTARDRNNVVGISNIGRSEISVFSVGTVETPIIPYGGTGPGPGGPIIDPGISPVFLANTLTGKLHYFWHNLSNHGATESTGSGGTLNAGTIGQVGNVAGGVNIDDGNRSNYGSFTQSPLAGVTVQLIQGIQFQSAPSTSPLSGPLLPGNILLTHTGQFHILNQPNMSAPTLATATTDGQGNFVFNVPNVQALDFGWRQGTVTLSGDFTGNLEGSYTGTFRRVLMVRVGNPARTYYAQPVQYNAALPANGDLGLFHAQVKSFDTKVLVAERQDLMIKKAGMRVYLLRKTNTKPSLVPMDEGKRGNTSAKRIMTVNLVQYEVLDSATTDAGGMVEFRDLVRFDCSSTSSNNLYYIWSRPEDAFFTQHSVHNTPQPVNYMYQNDWSSTGCYTPSTGAIAAACMKCNLATRDGFSTVSRSHARAYKGQDEWLYNVNRVVAQNPRVTALVKNSAAGAQGGLAMNEPGVTWRLWRLNRAAADHLRNGNASWGAMLESNQPDAFIMAQNALTQVGKPMVLQEMGATGSDGRIHSGFLPVQINSSNEQIGNFYVLDLQKQGFARKIHVVRRNVNASAGGTIPNVSILGTIGNPLGGSGGSTGSTGGSAPAQQFVGDVAMLRRGAQYHENELWMNPTSTLTLSFVGPNGTPVKCNSYYWDPTLGVEGVMAESQTITSPRSERRVMQVPGSPLTQLRVVVIPNNSDLYQRDTIMVSVPVGASVNHTVTVPYRLHRIHFVVREKPASNVGILPGQDPETVGTRIANARVLLVGTNAQMFPNEKHPDTNPGGASASVAGNVYERITDSQGRVDFAFKASAGESFTFRVMTPNDGPHVTQEVQVSSTPGKRWQVRNVQLERGRTVSGKVMIDSAAVAGAKVRWENGNLVGETTTNAQGEYTLTNVPRSLTRFTAAKAPYAGMTWDEAQTNSNAYGTAVLAGVDFSATQDLQLTINFQLRIYGGMDFGSILGFPLEVTDFQEQPAGQARISGWVTVPDSVNGIFRITQLSADGTDLRCVRFLNTVVEPDEANAYTIAGETVRPTKPVNLPMSLGVNEVSIGLYPTSGQQPYTYHGTLRDTQTGIALDRPAGGDTRGAVMGGVRVAAASFTDNNFALDDATISLVAPQGGMRLAAFASDARSWYPAGEPLNVANAQGQPFNYVLHGFQANSVTASSYLYKDSLVLDTRIHTALEHIPAPDNDLNLAIGRIKITGGQLQPFSGARSFTIPLGQFSLQGTELSMNNSGFGFKGVLNASGMDLQVDNGTLEPHRFLLGEMNATGMTLMGTIPVNASRAAEFGYDAVRPQPAWYVVVTSRDENVTAATISGQHLDGIPDNRDVPITSVWLYSNGAQEVALRNGIPGYNFFGISQFHLHSMVIGSNLLTLSGEIDFGMPGFPTFTTALLYNKTPNGISGYTLQDFAMPPVGLNGVQLAFNKGQQRGSFGVPGNQHCVTFAQGQLTIKGVISDQDPNVFKNLAYTLVKTPQQTKLTVDRNPQQSVRLGGDNPASRILMTDVEGEMWVVNGSNGPEWNTFYIKGNMPAEMGFEAQNGQPQRMRFEVRGDLAVENQQVKLKDIETPFGNINMVYDMQHHRLSGQLNVSHGVSNGPSMNGAAAIVIDKEGFYFMSGLNVNLSSPAMTGYAFVLLGDYAQRTPEMDALLMQYSLHVQKKIERRMHPLMRTVVQQLAVQNPQLAVQMALADIPDLFPPTYDGLFGGNRFNGFYFNAGAQIPLPVIPSFSIDCQPVVTLEMGCDGGIDVRFGANFGSGTYGVGFDTFVDIYLGGGASAGIICAYGRIGLFLSVGLDGVFSSNGNYTITGSGNVELSGNVTVGGGFCSIEDKCANLSCLHFKVGGTIGLGMQANISNSGSNFEFTMGSDGTNSQRNDPPPQEN